MEITHSYQGLGRGYSRVRKGTPRFAAFLVAHAGLDINDFHRPLTIVELGVGSGQQTEFAEKRLKKLGFNRYEILAYDKSYRSDSVEEPAQLNLLKDRIKKGEISERVVPVPYNFDGNPLPLSSESVDLSYMAWVLHHLKNQQEVLNDIARITRQGSRHFMYQVTIEDLENHPLDKFFPLKYGYDVQRYPTRSRLRQMFDNAGFTFEKPYAIKRDDPKLIDWVFLDGIF